MGLNASDSPFLLLTPRLLLLPTPSAISQASYRFMYAQLHTSRDFCTMGFGARFRLRDDWDDATWQRAIQSEVQCSWERRGMGDMAVGVWDGTRAGIGRVLSESETERKGEMKDEVRIVQGKAWDDLVGAGRGFWESVRWVGYAGVRDATTTSLPGQAEGDDDTQDDQWPPWLEMIELRYGVAPGEWGRGYAPEAARALMRWAARERGVTRFIAETERVNARSAAVLRKMGFVESGTDYWKEPLEREWERRVDSVVQVQALEPAV